MEIKKKEVSFVNFLTCFLLVIIHIFFGVITIMEVIWKEIFKTKKRTV